MPFRQTSRRFRRTLYSIVLLALALAQTLGLVHRIVHSPLAVHAAGFAGASGTPTRTDWLQALFSGHATEQGCHLYDQLSHSDLIHVDVAVVPVLHDVPTYDSTIPASHIAAQAVGFLARGPPLTC
jgi:hypothetical protein